jgi:nitrite reductase/ring-hydroxylating ferredoxin subunit
VARLDELAVGAARGLVLDGWPVLVARLPDKVCAVLDRCSHAAARLSGGRVRRGAICCPVHGALFDLATGRCVGDAYRPIASFPVRVVDGMVEVAVPRHPPAPDQLPVET